uniref:TIL domain-containing protein n=1 Tax=Glossina palpalis gambiensis TaxID=67801 RepID=A0A1B0BIJ3_9MUSC
MFFKLNIPSLASLGLLLFIVEGCWCAEDRTCTPQPQILYPCESSCRETCEAKAKTCPIVSIACYPSCYCVEAFVNNVTAECIPQAECP